MSQIHWVRFGVLPCETGSTAFPKVCVFQRFKHWKLKVIEALKLWRHHGNLPSCGVFELLCETGLPVQDLLSWHLVHGQGEHGGCVDVTTCCPVRFFLDSYGGVHGVCVLLCSAKGGWRVATL